MESNEPGRQVVHFGVFDLDLKAGELRRAGFKVKLQEQPFQILRILFEHSGDVVTHDEIIQVLWPNGTVVEYEHSVKTAVKKLRQALGDDAQTPRYVETLPRRGYRFIYPVGNLGHSLQPPPHGTLESLSQQIPAEAAAVAPPPPPRPSSSNQQDPRKRP